VQNTIIDLELSTTSLTNGCRNDDMIQLGPLRSQSLFSSSRSMMTILYTSVGQTRKMAHWFRHPCTNFYKRGRWKHEILGPRFLTRLCFETI